MEHVLRFSANGIMAHDGTLHIGGQMATRGSVVALTWFLGRVKDTLTPQLAHYTRLVSPKQVLFGATNNTAVMMPKWHGQHDIS